MNQNTKTFLFAIGVIALIVILNSLLFAFYVTTQSNIISNIGIMLVNQGKDQSNTNSQEATNITVSFGNAFIYAGVIGILLLVIVGIAWISKYV